MKLSLLVTQGSAKGKRIPITGPQFVIGRDPQCHLRPNSPIISKRHCALLTRANKVYVRDFNSTNGTFLNDKPIKEELEISNNDRLKVGPLTFVVHIEADTSVGKPTPMPRPKAQDDEAVVAEMLLSMQDEEETVDGPFLSNEEPTQESTALDIKPPPPPADAEEDPKTEVLKKPEPSKTSMNTQSAAEAILAKYARRNRK